MLCIHIMYIYTDLPNDAKFLFFRNYCFFLWNLHFFPPPNVFWFWVILGHLDFHHGADQNLKRRNFPPKKRKTHQVGRHSLAAKTPTMKRRYFWKRAKNIPNNKKSVASTSNGTFAQSGSSRYIN